MNRSAEAKERKRSKETREESKTTLEEMKATKQTKRDELDEPALLGRPTGLATVDTGLLTWPTGPYGSQWELN